MEPFYTYVGIHRNRVVHRYVSRHGERKIDVQDYQFSLYLPSADGEYRGMRDEPLKRKKFDSARDMREWYNDNRDILEIHGMERPEFQFIADKYRLRPQPFDFSKIVIANIDIETEVGNGFPDPDKAEQEINAITVSVVGSKYYTTFTTLDYDESKDDGANENSEIILCTSETELIQRFMNHIDILRPDAYTGWNIVMFDLPYIVNRCLRLGLRDYRLLSPIHEHAHNTVSKKTNNVTGKDEIRIEGAAILDYIALYKKFGGTQASYKLDYIAQKELGKGKVDYGEYANIKEFYLGNPTKFVRYNVNDVALIDELEEKKRYLLLVYTLQYDAKCNTQDAMGQVKLWDSYIFNYCRAHDIIIPPHSKEMPKEIEGAFVLDPKIGLSKWVVSFDLSSLYPSLIQQYNMGYDTIVRHNQKRKGLLEEMIAMKPIPEVEEAHNIGCSIAANGTLYRNDKTAVASICVKEMFDSRQDYRKRLKKLLIEIEELHHINESAKHLEKDTPMLDAFQLAKKVAINAYYGAQANEAFRYYNPDIAEAITMSGQMTIRFIGDKVCKYLDELFRTDTGHERWPGGDTDSIYISMDYLADKLKNGREIPNTKICDAIDKFCKDKLEPFIAEQYEELAKYVNAHHNTMSMKREVIAHAAMWRAKKNYVMEVLDDEGAKYYDTPKLKTMGVETARTTTPGFVKEALKNCYRIMLNGTNAELLDYMNEFKLEYDKVDIDTIATPRGVNNLDKWVDHNGDYKVKIPFHVRASLEYNRLLDEHGLIDLPKIQDGDKIKLIKLVNASPVSGGYIAYQTHLPPEFELEPYIDREALYQSTFVSPVESFTSKIGWKHIDEFSVDDFFG